MNNTVPSSYEKQSTFLLFVIIISFFISTISQNVTDKINPQNFLVKTLKNIPKYCSLWNWPPTSIQANIYNMEKKNSLKNTFIYYGIFSAPFIYTMYQIKKRLESVYKNDRSVMELLFNFEAKKQKTNINAILNHFFNTAERKKFLLKKLGECITEAEKEENQYNNYVIYYKTYLKQQFTSLSKRINNFLYLSSNSYFFEIILFNFTWQLISLKKRYDLKKLKNALEIIIKEIEIREEEEEEEKNKTEIEELYSIIQTIKKYPNIDFLAKNPLNPITIKTQVTHEIEAKKEPVEKIQKISNLEKIKKKLFTLLSLEQKTDNKEEITQLHKEKIDDKLKNLFIPLSVKNEERNDNFITFIKKEIASIVELPGLKSLHPRLKSAWISNIFTLSLLILNTYPWFYFSDLRNTFNPYPGYKLKF